MPGIVESERVESKLSLNEWREVVESVAAFATAHGGTVRLGVRPDGTRAGVQIGRNTLEKLANDIKGNTDPPQYPSIAVEGDERAAVIVVTIEESPIKPVWAFGRPYTRVGRSNQRLSREETHRLMDVTTGRTWDALPCAGFREDDIDSAAVSAFLRRAELPADTAADNMLESLSLLTPDGPCNAAALLFAGNPQRFFPEALVKCGRFRGATSIEFLDEQTLGGTAVAQLDGALAFVARNTRQAIRITGRPEREIVPEYPDAAVREAVTNAICHRDYAAAGTVQVRIYDDRLEVWNPGTLPVGLSVDALYHEHPSRPHNRRIASAFYRARLIEHWGTGTLRIIGACVAAGLSEPEFRVEGGMFTVRFRAPAPPAMAVDVPLDPAERRRRALAYVREHGRITRAEYQRLFGLGERQALQDLTVLVGSGSLARRGSRGPGTHYVVPDPPSAGG